MNIIKLNNGQDTRSWADALGNGIELIESIEYHDSILDLDGDNVEINYMDYKHSNQMWNNSNFHIYGR